MDLRGEIKTIIKKDDISIRQLSLKSGVRRQSIMHFLNGGNIHIHNLEKILNTLGYDLKLTKTVPPKQIERSLGRRLQYSEAPLFKFCRENGIRSLSVFGSVLRKDFNKNSDIDILIEFNKPIDFFKFASIEEGLRNILKTDRHLDIVTAKSISPLLIEEINKSREVIYEEAA